MSKKLIAGAGVVASLAVALAPLATYAADTLTPNAQKDILSVTLEKVCAFGYTSTNGVSVAAGKHTDGTPLSPNTSSDTGTVETNQTAGKSFGKWNIASVTGYDGTVQTPSPDTDTAYAIMENGTVNLAFAKTQLNIVCNNLDGYRLSAVAGDLEDINASTNNNDEVIEYDRVVPTIADSNWSFYLTDVTTTGITNTTTEVAGSTENVPEGKHKLEEGAGSRTVVANAFTAEIEDDSQEDLYNVVAYSDGATSKTGDRYEITYGVSVDSALPAGTYKGSVVYTLAQIAD